LPRGRRSRPLGNLAVISYQLSVISTTSPPIALGGFAFDFPCGIDSYAVYSVRYIL
jgi:hypothetical protein